MNTFPWKHSKTKNSLGVFSSGAKAESELWEHKHSPCSKMTISIHFQHLLLNQCPEIRMCPAECVHGLSLYMLIYGEKAFPLTRSQTENPWFPQSSGAAAWCSQTNTIGHLQVWSETSAAPLLVCSSFCDAVLELVGSTFVFVFAEQTGLWHLVWSLWLHTTSGTVSSLIEGFYFENGPGSLSHCCFWLPVLTICSLMWCRSAVELCGFNSFVSAHHKNTAVTLLITMFQLWWQKHMKDMNIFPLL